MTTQSNISENLTDLDVRVLAGLRHCKLRIVATIRNLESSGQAIEVVAVLLAAGPVSWQVWKVEVHTQFGWEQVGPQSKSSIETRKRVLLSQRDDKV